MTELTAFQERVYNAIKRAPNQMANTWEIVWNDFSKEWEEKRSSHGALFRCILQAGYALKRKGLIVILPPRDQHDTYTFCISRFGGAAQQSTQPTVATCSACGRELLPDGSCPNDDPSTRNIG